MLRKAVVAIAVLMSFAAGAYLGGRRPAVAHAQSLEARASLTPLPGAWGPVRAALGRDQITLILEDEAGTIRAVTLEPTVDDKGKAVVAPRLYAEVPRK
jgi:hypothetical protein